MRLSFSHKLQSESDVRSIQSLEDGGFGCCEIMFPEREPLDEQTLNLIDEVSGTTNLYLTSHLPYKNVNIASVYQYVRESSTDLLLKIIDDVSDYVDMVTLHTGLRLLRQRLAGPGHREQHPEPGPDMRPRRAVRHPRRRRERHERAPPGR